jgi:hypoxanthine phosphoribosyltransferase
MKVYIEEKKIQEKVKQIGLQISEEYVNKKPLLIAVLKGGFIFISDLVRSIDCELGVDFIFASSYGESIVSSGNVKITQLDELKIRGRNVILVEDIIDSGLTLNRIYSEILLKNPESLKVCALLVKRDKHRFSHKIDYVGFEIEDKFVVGYGLDLNENYRNLPYIGLID